VLGTSVPSGTLARALSAATLSLLIASGKVEPRRVSRRPKSLRGWAMRTQGKRFSSEVRERAVRMVFDHRGEYATQ
jgi:hypothetical protein